MNGETGGGGLFEPEHRPARGNGMPNTARCDECHRDSAAARRQAKVLKGPLRGIRGMVCVACLELRVKAPA